MGQPAAPPDAERVAHVVVQRPDGHREHQEHDRPANGRPVALGVPGGQRRGQLAALPDELQVEAGLPDQQRRQQYDQQARLPALLGAPVGRGDRNEAAPAPGVKARALDARVVVAAARRQGADGGQ